MGQFDDLFQKDWEQEYKKLEKKYDDLVREATDYERELDLSNKRNLRQSKEIDGALDLLKRLRPKVSDSDWTEVLEDHKKAHEGEASLVEDEDGNDES